MRKLLRHGCPPCRMPSKHWRDRSRNAVFRRLLISLCHRPGACCRFRPEGRLNSPNSSWPIRTGGKSRPVVLISAGRLFCAAGRTAIRGVGERSTRPDQRPDRPGASGQGCARRRHFRVHCGHQYCNPARWQVESRFIPPAVVQPVAGPVCFRPVMAVPRMAVC